MTAGQALIVITSLGWCLCAAATERQAYKIVDEKGNVTYSQTPPAQGKDAKKVDISPANSSRGGYAGGAPSSGYQQSYGYTQDGQAMQSYQKQREEAEQKRLTALKAECNRNRGTDCDNPETLRLMESQKIPGGRYYQR